LLGLHHWIRSQRHRPADPASRQLADEPILTAYALEPRPAMRLVPAPSARAWMAGTPERFAYRCLPLLIANQAGWLVLNPEALRATWNGAEALDSVRVESIGCRPPAARSHFGCGILTWTLPYLFRTPPGWNLLVRGPANYPKDGVYALEGVVETDWSPATFTMNWKFTRPDVPVVFERGEPICMLVPHRRGELERFLPRIRDLEQATPVADDYAAWARGRAAFLSDLRRPGSDAQRRGWQRDYLRGVPRNDSTAPGHQTKLRLRPFVTEQRAEHDL
jgi:hypothetical protein